MFVNSLLNMRMLSINLCTFFVALVVEVQGTSYFISPSGNDNSAGTSPSTPWRSAARASEVLFAPGDAVLFQGDVNHLLSEGGAGLTVRSSGLHGAVSSPTILVSSYGNGAARLVGNGSSFDAITILNTGGVEVCNISVYDVALTLSPHSIVHAGIHALSTGQDNDAPKFSNVYIHDVSVTGFLYGFAVDAFSSCQGFAHVRIERVLATNATGTGISSQGSYSSTCYSHHDILVADSAANWNQVQLCVSPHIPLLSSSRLPCFVGRRLKHQQLVRFGNSAIWCGWSTHITL